MSAGIEDQLRQAVLSIRSLKREVQRLRSDRRPAIAIVGVGCRFPGGADSPDAFWRLLMAATDAVREVPADRWDAEAWYHEDPEMPGRMNTRWGAFLSDIDRFDPEFFELSGREAAAMDPQQRLLLEVAWEALEHAGIAPDRLAGSAAGVYLGINASEYYQMAMTAPGSIDAHAISGGVASVAAGRLSYLLGLEGPALAVDTACSSSLAAVHLAVQSLRSGESRVALAGGVYTVLQPHLTVGLSKLRMMAADGRCKTFDAAADGFVQGEGCALVVLKRLEDAQTDGDRVLAVIRGSAMNQDGRSGSLTAPSRSAQVQVIREALADARLEPGCIGYVETHGTGTQLGDPIELHALADVLGPKRTQPLVLGAVKTNIGHLGPAAGIAGLVKAALAVREGRIPPNLHFRELNPKIQLDGLPAVFPQRATTWPESEGPRAAGVSSFGFSGTNVHLILEQAPPGPSGDQAPVGCGIFCLSARNEAALAEARRRHQAALLEGLDFAAACRTSASGRRHFEHRLAVVAGSAAEARDALGTAAATHCPRRPRLAFLFTGQGAWTPGTGRRLYDLLPAFRETLDRAESIAPGVQASLFAPDTRLDSTAAAQPALLALQWALVEQFQAWGIAPAAVAGHSVGEFAAAAAAGVLEWPEALRLVTERGRLMGELPAGGAMAAVIAPERVLLDALGPDSDRVDLAAFNGPDSLVLSGAAEALDRVLDRLSAQGIAHKHLQVSHGFHSPLMEPALADLQAAAARVAHHAPRLTLVSSLTGKEARALQATHWTRHAREPVRFADALRTLAELGCTAFLEIGPGATLTGVARTQLDHARTLTSVHGEDEIRALLEAVAGLHTAGIPVDWRSLLGAGPKASLPTYPFQRRRYWRRTQIATPAADDSWPPGKRIRSPAREAQFRLLLGLQAFPWLRDHQVHDLAVVPGAFQIVCLLGAWRALHGSGPCRIEPLTFVSPLLAPEEGEVELWTLFDPDGSARLASYDDRAWNTHAEARLAADCEEPGTMNIQALRQACRKPFDPEDWHLGLAALGIQVGPAFRGIRRFWRGSGEALAQVELASGLATPDGAIHPALLDACLQTAGGSFGDQAGDQTLLPLGIDRLEIHARLEGPLWVHARCTAAGALFSTDLDIADADGRVLMAVRGLHAKSAPEELVRRDPIGGWFYRVDWMEAPVPGPSPGNGTRLVLAPDRDTGLELRRRMTGKCVLAVPGPDLRQVAETEWSAPPEAIGPLVQRLGSVTSVVELHPWRDAREDGEAACRRLLAVLQSLVGAGAQASLCLVTRGAMLDTPRPWSSALWGLAASFGLEHTELTCRRIDADDLEWVARELAAADDGEDAVVWRGGVRRTARLVPTRPGRATTPRLRDTVLITGGLGGIGRELARWAAARGATQLVLVGRRADTDEARAFAGSLPVPTRLAAADMGDSAQVEALLGELSGLPPLRTILHAAGAQAEGLLANMDWPRFREALAAKALGAWWLHQASLGRELDHFVLFSSLASVLGAAGQGGYAAANALLDGLARHRRAQGLPALSVAWGRWDGAGMAAGLDAAAIRRLDALGLHPMPPVQALEALDRLFGSELVDPLVAAVDWNRWRERHPSGRTPALLRGLDQTKSDTHSGGLRERLAGCDRAERPLVFQTWLAEEARRILNRDPARELDPQQALIRLGLDSLMAVELRNRIQASLGTAPSIARLLGGASLAELAVELGADGPTPATEEWEELTL